MKRKIKFKLNRPKTLVPIIGESMVTVLTDGLVKVFDLPTTRHRQQRGDITYTRHGMLWHSPLGMRRTVKINMCTSEATEEAVVAEVRRLFCKMKEELLP